MARKPKREGPLIVADNLGIRFRINRQKPMRARVKERLTPGTGDQRRAEDFWALREVSFEIGRGEGVGLIGANGHGKSTLLRLMAGVMIPDEGSIRVRGEVAPMIEVTGGFVGDLTVRDNIWLAAGLKGLSKRQIAAKFDDIVEWAEIGSRLDTPLRHLSSGMKAKVGFSVITSVERPIVLVDEVLSVGDRAFKQKCFKRMDEMLGNGKTVVLVSHSQKQIERFCSRGIYLKHGRLMVDGPVQEAIAAYNADVDQLLDERALAYKALVARRRERRAARRASMAAELEATLGRRSDPDADADEAFGAEPSPVDPPAATGTGTA
jgi:ABC-2 type transport system ATP-binding protein